MWTLYQKNAQTLCRSCGKKISSKPSESCTEHKHTECYEKNANATVVRREQAHAEALVKYSGFDPPRCVLCMYDNIVALQFDHVEGDGAIFRREHKHQTGKSLALWLRKQGWPTGYRVLCANCQCIERGRIGNHGGHTHGPRKTLTSYAIDPL
jgi:hypothetical protein